MTTREEKVKELMESLHSLKRRGTFRFPGPVGTPHITPAQWNALMLVGEQGTSTVKGVAEALGVTSSAATQLVDGLVESGYVLREVNPADRRGVQLVCSKKTKNHVEAMKKQVLKNFLQLFKALSDKEFDQYLSLNKKIVEKFSK